MKPRSPGKAGNGYSLAWLQQIHLESACLSILISCLARHIFYTFIVTAVIFRGLQRLRFFVRQRPEFHPTVREFSNIFHGDSPSRVRRSGRRLRKFASAQRFRQFLSGGPVVVSLL